MIAAFEYVLEMKRRKINIVVTSGSYANASYNQTLKDLIDAAGDEGTLIGTTEKCFYRLKRP